MSSVLKVKEWLCLNCQMKRAVGASEPSGAPMKVSEKSLRSPSKVLSTAAHQMSDSSKPTTPKKDSSSSVASKETSEQFPPQGKESTSSVPSEKPESQKEHERGPKKPLDQASHPISKQGDLTTTTQHEAGGSFGFGSPQSQPDVTKPAVMGKMFGFGSSIISSASSLITSTVQDQPNTTPLISPKMSPAKDVKSLSAQKLEKQTKTEPPQESRTPPPEQAKSDKAQPALPKPVVASQAIVKPSESTCPLCKTTLNICSKDLPNYNTCTECKNIVCNQCGFNPMPNETAVRTFFFSFIHSKFES